MVSGLAGLIFGGINIFALTSVLRGNYLPLFRNEKSAFVTAFVICLAMCSIGINNMLKNADFRIAGFITGGLMGIVLLATFIFVVAGKPVPVIGSVRNSLVLLLSLMSVKMIISTVNIVSLSLGRG